MITEFNAGIYFYDALVKNRRSKYTANDDTFWREELEKQYELAAASIAVYNIWVNQPNVFYDNIGLEKLKNFKPISIKNYPLPYIFGFVDTIDPIKFFCF